MLALRVLLASPRVDGGVSRNVAARQLITCANRRNHHSSRCRRQLIAETFFCHFERSEPKVNAVEKSQHCVFLRFLRAGYALSRNDNGSITFTRAKPAHHSSRCRRQLIAETFFCHFERSEPKVNAVEKSQHCVFLRFLRAGYALSRNDNGCITFARPAALITHHAQKQLIP